MNYTINLIGLILSFSIMIFFFYIFRKILLKTSLLFSIQLGSLQLLAGIIRFICNMFEFNYYLTNYFVISVCVPFEDFITVFIFYIIKNSSRCGMGLAVCLAIFSSTYENAVSLVAILNMKEITLARNYDMCLFVLCICARYLLHFVINSELLFAFLQRRYLIISLIIFFHFSFDSYALFESKIQRFVAIYSPGLLVLGVILLLYVLMSMKYRLAFKNISFASWGKSTDSRD